MLTDIPDGSPGYGEELFGPVALFRVRVTSTTPSASRTTPTFGLGGSAWTTDPAEQERFIDEIEAGHVFVNALVGVRPRLPFGGIKNSGYGRELAGTASGVRQRQDGVDRRRLIIHIAPNGRFPAGGAGNPPA